MPHKTIEAEVKAADNGEGRFSAYASVFNNVDLVGDRIMPGAFAKVLEAKREKGKPIPVVFSHDWDDPMKFIGKADPNDVIETDHGLMVNGSLNIDSNPMAKQIYDLMRDGLITDFSFGYLVAKDGEKVKDGVNEINEMKDLIEVGPTMRGANPEAQLQAIKAMKQLDADLSLEDKVNAIVDRRLKEFAQDQEDKDAEGKEAQASDPTSDPLKDEIESMWMDTFIGTPKGD